MGRTCGYLSLSSELRQSHILLRRTCYVVAEELFHKHEVRRDALLNETRQTRGSNQCQKVLHACIAPARTNRASEHSSFIWRNQVHKSPQTAQFETEGRKG